MRKHTRTGVPVFLLLWAGLSACSGDNGSTETNTTTDTKSVAVPTSFYGTWVLDVPARTPPDPQPDHYARTEYEIGTGGRGATLTKYSAALDLKTGQEWFRNKLNGPLPCMYISYRACLACGTDQQVVKDSLFLEAGKLINRSPLASNRMAAGKGPLVLTRKPENKP